jgi:hypothetical protein
VTAYYLGPSVQWAQWANTWTFSYTDPATGKQLQNGPAYADAIRHRYFTVIVLNFGDTYAEDQIITTDINRFGGYRLTTVIPYRTDAGSSAYRIWTLIPLNRHPPARRRHRSHA